MRDPKVIQLLNINIIYFFVLAYDNSSDGNKILLNGKENS